MGQNFINPCDLYSSCKGFSSRQKKNVCARSHTASKLYRGNPFFWRLQASIAVNQIGLQLDLGCILLASTHQPVLFSTMTSSIFVDMEKKYNAE